MKRIFFLSFIGILFINNAIGQAAGNWIVNQKKSTSLLGNESYYNVDHYTQKVLNYNIPLNNDTILEISTNVLMNVKADTYVAIFGLSQTGENIEVCQKLIDSRISDFTKSLNEIGISKNDVFIDFISQVPIFEIEVDKKLFSKSYNEIPAGFEVKKNIHIKFHKSNFANKIMAEAAKNEIYDIIKVDYIVNNLSAVYDTLRKVSTELAVKKTNDFKKLGVNINSSYITTEETINSTYPLTKYSAYKAFGSNSNAKKISSKSVRLSAENQPTVFYNQLPYNIYDIVINPNIFEPSVQFTYKLKTRYVLKKK